MVQPAHRCGHLAHPGVSSMIAFHMTLTGSSTWSTNIVLMNFIEPGDTLWRGLTLAKVCANPQCMSAQW